MMKFNDGDRVHVTRFNDKNVDFYGTVYHYLYSPRFLKLKDCSNNNYENRLLWKGLADGNDYYTLETDEEDTEKPEIQYISDMYNAPCERLERRTNNVELDDEYIIEVKKGLYVRGVDSNDFFKFTRDIEQAKIYGHKVFAKRDSEIIDGRVLNLKRYVEVE